MFQSLAVDDGAVLGGKLGGANSVNSIAAAQKAAEEDDLGRVAGWAVGFPRLLADPVGISIFTVSTFFLCDLCVIIICEFLIFDNIQTLIVVV